MTASVLVVDDQPDGRDMLADYLTQCGYEVHTAVDGLDAIDVALRIRPAVILMDLMMPRMDGWEAILRLKTDRRTQDIPIVALTASSDAKGICAADVAGCRNVLSKPCDLDRIAEVVRECLAPSRGN